MGKPGQYLSNKRLPLVLHASMKVLYVPSSATKNTKPVSAAWLHVCKKDYISFSEPLCQLIVKHE